MDYTLKFASQAEAEKALFKPEASIVDGVEETILRSKYAAIDLIGTIYAPTGVMPKDDIPGMVAVDGYHANVRHSSEAPELDAFVIAVLSPVRVWAD
jgi:hypothetical protein